MSLSVQRRLAVGLMMWQRILLCREAVGFFLDWFWHEASPIDPCSPAAARTSVSVVRAPQPDQTGNCAANVQVERAGEGTGPRASP